MVELRTQRAAMRFLRLTLPTPPANLALDEALLLRAEAGEAGEVLRLWEQPSHAVVLGAGCRLADDVDEAACRDDRVPILRRSSGGGTVLLGSGCLVYTLILDSDRAPELAGIRSSYSYILTRIASVLPAGNGVEPAGISDLAITGSKFSGNCATAKTSLPLAPRHIALCLRPKPRGTILAAAVAPAGVPRRPRSCGFPSQSGNVGG